MISWLTRSQLGLGLLNLTMQIQNALGIVMETEKDRDDFLSKEKMSSSRKSTFCSFLWEALAANSSTCRKKLPDNDGFIVLPLVVRVNAPLGQESRCQQRK